jgi:hypothetical protein
VLPAASPLDHSAPLASSSCLSRLGCVRRFEKFCSQGHSRPCFSLSAGDSLPSCLFCTLVDTHFRLCPHQFPLGPELLLSCTLAPCALALPLHSLCLSLSWSRTCAFSIFLCCGSHLHSFVWGHFGPLFLFLPLRSRMVMRTTGVGDAFPLPTLRSYSLASVPCAPNFNSTAMLLAISRNIFLEIARTVYW